MLTPRQISILRLLRRYFYMRTAQIRDGAVAHDQDGSITRDCLRKLLTLGLVRRHEPKMVDGMTGNAPPIFVLTIQGSCALAEATGDMALLLGNQPNFTDWMSLNHYCALSSLHMTIDAAFARQSRARLHALYFEHEVIQPDAEGGQKYRLYTTVSHSPTIFCCPDSAIETEVDGYRRAWFIEREMGSDTPARVAAKKCKGHHGMSSKQLFKRIFPEARDMRVLAFCPNAGWRDLLRKEMRNKPGADLWLFLDVTVVTGVSFLDNPMLYTVDNGPFSFLPKDSGASSGGGALSGAEAGGQQRA